MSHDQGTTSKQYFQKKFSISNYDAIGFDLDGTLAMCNFKEMVQAAYRGISKYLIEVCKYRPKLLDMPIEHDKDFIVRGVIMDLKRGNFLRISGDGTILQATHGIVYLTKKDIKKYYGENCTWSILTRFCKEPEYSQSKIFVSMARVVFSEFDVAIALAFARCVTTCDQLGITETESKIFTDIISALHSMDSYGGFLNKIRTDPRSIIKPCSPFVRAYLKRIKASGKLTYLISNSNSGYVIDIIQHCVGNDWTTIFDVVLCEAGKPQYFNKDGRLREALSGKVVTSMEKRRVYSGGDWKAMHNFIKQELNMSNPKIAYVGDDIICDVYSASKVGIDCIFICKELSVEGVFGYTKFVGDSEYLSPGGIWGSYFFVGEGRKSVWHEMIVNHAACTLPSMEYLAGNTHAY